MVAVKVWSSVAALSFVCGCAAPKPVPLYPPDEKPLASEIATLHGDVGEVDGKFVSEHGGTFALRSGCHVVGVVKTWGRMNDSAAVTANLPPIVFVMEMQGGYRYVVRVDALMDSGGLHGKLTVVGREQDAEGNVTREFPALKAGASCPTAAESASAPE